ncbi:MAG TPA: hypothetical protein VFV58_39260 [Blastocatellia bacterium]|nr:hypothetical protein [Blastocatellia bacterium]
MQDGRRQGQGLSTCDKGRRIAAMFSMSMRILYPGDTYYHFDLNAGSGWNDEYGVPGTPLVFLELAQKHLRRWKAMFFELDNARAGELETRLRGRPNCRVEMLDNRHFMEWAKGMPPHAVGSIVIDPNGWLYRSRTGAGVPVAEIIECCARFPRMDLIMNLNLRHYRLMRGDLKANPEKAHRRLYRLEEMPKLFHRPHGLISDRSNHGHGQFVRMILRSARMRPYDAMGWHLLDSPEAKEIYRLAEMTTEEGDVAHAIGRAI